MLPCFHYLYSLYKFTLPLRNICIYLPLYFPQGAIVEPLLKIASKAFLLPKLTGKTSALVTMYSIYICTHARTHARTHTHTRAHTHTHKHTHTHARTHTHASIETWHLQMYGYFILHQCIFVRRSWLQRHISAQGEGLAVCWHGDSPWQDGGKTHYRPVTIDPVCRYSMIVNVNVSNSKLTHDLLYFIFKSHFEKSYLIW